MRQIHANLRMRISTICLSLLVLLISVLHVQATEVDDLKDKTSGLESELSDMNKELKALEKELNHILSEIKNTATQLETTKEELAIAKGQEQVQYESMMLRIKYMYENGNFNMLEMLFDSSCIAEFLNRAEFFAKISEYDRDLLEEYTENTQKIAEKEAQLVKDQKYLNALQAELDVKEKELKDKISSTSTQLSEYTAKLEKAKEEARKAEAAAKEQIKPVIPDKNHSGQSSFGTSYRDPIAYTDEDIELLAGLLECEAGSSNYEALLAVASVVANRMNSIYYPDTLYGVIYQPGQFPPAHNGKLDRILANGVKPKCVTAATDALNGKNNVGDCLSFRAASPKYDGVVIGDNVFF